MSWWWRNGSWHFTHEGMGFIAWSFVFFEVSETALGRKKWYPYLRESAFRDVSRHSFISRMKGPWESDCCKSYWEVWRDERPVHGSDFMRISISFFFLAWLHMCVMCFFKYMYWWTYSRLAALETLLPLFCPSLLYIAFLFVAVLLYHLLRCEPRFHSLPWLGW